MGKWDAAAQMPGKERVTIAVSGARGGETIDFRRLAAQGMILVGRTEAFVDGKLSFADSLAAVASADRVENWRAAGLLPLLQYSRGSFLGLLTSLAQGQPGAPDTFIAHVNENSMAEAMKFMALEGHGVAWLPRSLVEDEIAQGRLQVVAPELPMEIRLYRNGARARARGVVERVWQAAQQGYSEHA